MSSSAKLSKAVALHQQGQLVLAQSIYDEILGSQPNHFDALHLSGVIALQTGNPSRAVGLIRRAVVIGPDDASAYCNLGAAFNALREFDDALACYVRAIALKPDYSDAHFNCGIVLGELGQLNAALDSYERAIAIKPHHAQANANRAAVLQRLNRLDDALDSCNRAIAIKADFAEAYFVRGNIQLELRQMQPALASFDQAIVNNTGFAEAHCHRGIVLKEMLRLDAALASFNRAVAIKTDYADAYWNRAFVSLMRCDFERGWADLEWRWKKFKGRNPKAIRHFPQPIWGGEPIAGKTILLHGEQGLGDTIQFCRYAKLVSDLGAHVILEVQDRLTSLLAQLPGVSQVIAAGSPLPDFDCHCPLMSLPLRFATRLETIPASQPYLRADAAEVMRWRARLGERSRPRVGLAWRGNPTHPNDGNRSVHLRDLVGFLPAHCEYFSLQKDIAGTDGATLDANPHIRHAPDEVGDFDKTAALCDALDLVISVDTSIAHLSAALGRKTWILMPFLPDWRWLLDRRDSPWYPTVTLYRQRSAGDWHDVFQNVRTDLINTFGSTGSR
jgi:tetratricopeptide (TPR) repeat protein